MKNVLFVSVAFPPKSDAEGLQVAKYLKYLIREGLGAFIFDAVTSAQPTLNMPSDPSLQFAAEGVRQTVELPIYENRYTNLIIRKLAPWAATMPDPKFSFGLQASRVRSHLRQKPDLIYSRSFPLSSAVLAYSLKKTLGVPWVMHLSDVWADCPERNYSGLSRFTQEKLERQCFEAADVVCVTSEKTRQLYERKYRHLGRRIELFPNVYDLEDQASLDERGPVQEVRLPGKFRIVHTGSLVGSRSALPLLTALSRLPQAMQARLEVILAGPMDRANRRAIESMRLPFVNLFGHVGYQQSLRLQRSADLLVLIDMPVANPDLRVFFPSKLLDYMLSRRPILAITDAGSEVERVFSQGGVGTSIERADTERLTQFLAEIVSHPESALADMGRQSPETYSAEHHAKRLLGLFGELTAS
jgi:glycosyltransferase involved in cell wall biosynthesis